MLSNHKFQIFFLALALILNSCAAQYQTIKKGQNATEDLKPDNNDNLPDGDTTPDKQQGPVANIEVIFNGQSVSEVPVGSQVIIRPTKETRDLDDAPNDSCPNVGIVSAQYTVGSSSPESVSRAPSSACTPLSLNYTFSQAGQVEIKLVVKSDEDEQGEASMTLTISPASNQGNAGPSGFRIEATPMVAPTNETINFKGFCVAEKETKISWNFPDAAPAEGKFVQYRFAKSGSYKIDALCTDGEHQLQASVTIAVLPSNEQIDPDTDEDEPRRDDPSDDTSTDLGGNNGGKKGDSDTGNDPYNEGDDEPPIVDPSQNPGQNPGQLPSQN